MPAGRPGCAGTGLGLGLAGFVDPPLVMGRPASDGDRLQTTVDYVLDSRCGLPLRPMALLPMGHLQELNQNWWQAILCASCILCGIATLARLLLIQPPRTGCVSGTRHGDLGPVEFSRSSEPPHDVRSSSPSTETRYAHCADGPIPPAEPAAVPATAASHPMGRASRSASGMLSSLNQRLRAKHPTPPGSWGVPPAQVSGRHTFRCCNVARR